MPGQLIGTAPQAAYWLLRSEDGISEYIIEEYNWVCAAEFADSVGADIINSSLGYRIFNDPSTDHTCEDMNGNTTPVTRGANIAFSKGILVVNSAGNEGGNVNWPCVSAPSDGFDVLAIAAVDSLGQYASFSSTGSVNGDYVKPNVAAMGRLTVLCMTDGTIGRSNGTSFSSPVIAGSAACLWQAFPGFSNATIKKAIEESGSQYANPDKYLGYGIPNMYEAWQRLTSIEESPDGSTELVAYPNPIQFGAATSLRYFSEKNQEVEIEVYDMMGKRRSIETAINMRSGQNIISLSMVRGLPSGTYIIRLIPENNPTKSSKTIIQIL